MLLSLFRMLRKNTVYARYIIGIFHIGVDGNKAAGCSKASLSTTAADQGTGECITPLDYAENACEARSHWWTL